MTISLAIGSQKGGVGKSTTTVQLAYHLVDRGHTVVVVDLDHQANTTNAFRKGGIAALSATPASAALLDPAAAVESSPLVVLPADGTVLRGLERRTAEHNEMASNFAAFLRRLGTDIAIVDTNPNPDIRQLSALVTASFVLSPVELTQESVDGIGALLHDPQLGIRRIQAALRPDLVLLGILPNAVDPTPFQRENMRDLAAAYGDLLIPMDGGGYAAVRRSTAIAEAQASGVPIWQVRDSNGATKTSAREAGRQIRLVFDRIAGMMGLQQ